MYERDPTSVLKGLQLINRLNLLSCTDGKPLNIWLQIIAASSDMLSAAADGCLLMPFSYTLLVGGRRYRVVLSDFNINEPKIRTCRSPSF